MLLAEACPIENQQSTNKIPQRVSLIAAMAENRAIGIDGGLPWKLPDEMAQFRAYTLGHAVIMGRVNFEVEANRCRTGATSC